MLYLDVADVVDEVIWSATAVRPCPASVGLSYAGEFTFLHMIAMNSKGDLLSAKRSAVAEDKKSRPLAISIGFVAESVATKLPRLPR